MKYNNWKYTFALFLLIELIFSLYYHTLMGFIAGIIIGLFSGPLGIIIGTLSGITLDYYLIP